MCYKWLQVVSIAFVSRWLQSGNFYNVEILFLSYETVEGLCYGRLKFDSVMMRFRLKID